ncbi:hypothetical protein A3F08_01980 [Candidatus Berkelbacteria bacterium RIFCSPHIGHO2_12_FULL_36_9]|uniref:CopG family transcriptional regulator n=1 Tax=Candidatus Berkelbacteria bacterium RIFCSPHIGHO2_12_FULL_36_9 TaxID=1797469 RepID=A0A1F5EGS9_9BACT|nr:MAG: hypothetical protein A3F08_01980 [Candidatus Berkelbacteria bacterium RIFCSPHIGHO2_12_FULL_36_9]
MKNLKRIPKFKSENEERNFWSRADSTQYLDYSKARRVKLSNLKPSTRKISFRIPEYLLEDLRQAANKRDIPYQSYMKKIIMRGLSNEKCTK